MEATAESLCIVRRAAIFVESGMKSENSGAKPVLLRISAKRVAELVSDSDGTEEERAIILMIEAVERGKAELDDIARNFGAKFRIIVEDVLKPQNLDLKQIPTHKHAQSLRLGVLAHDWHKTVKRIKLARQIAALEKLRNARPKGWTNENRLHYIRGTKHIAEVCKGVSKKLDQAYDDAYMNASARFYFSR